MARVKMDNFVGWIQLQDRNNLRDNGYSQEVLIICHPCIYLEPLMVFWVMINFLHATPLDNPVEISVYMLCVLRHFVNEIAHISSELNIIITIDTIPGTSRAVISHIWLDHCNLKMWTGYLERLLLQSACFTFALGLLHLTRRVLLPGCGNSSLKRDDPDDLGGGGYNASLKGTFIRWFMESIYQPISVSPWGQHSGFSTKGLWM